MKLKQEVNRHDFKIYQYNLKGALVLHNWQPLPMTLSCCPFCALSYGPCTGIDNHPIVKF